MLTRFLQAGKWWVQTDREWRQLYSHRENVAVKSQEQLCFICVRFILTFSCRDGLNSEFCTSLENGAAESSLLVISSAQHRLYSCILFLKSESINWPHQSCWVKYPWVNQSVTPAIHQPTTHEEYLVYTSRPAIHECVIHKDLTGSLAYLKLKAWRIQN